MSSVASNRCPFRTFLNLGNRKKSHGARSGEYGGCCNWAVPCLAKKLLHKMWSVCGRIVVVQDPVAIPPFFRSFSANWFTQTSQYLQVEFLVIVCLSGAYSWCTIPSEKNASNMTFVLLLPSLNRRNQTLVYDPLHLHRKLAAIIDTFPLRFFRF